ncbi:EAL domain-containing protein, partial [Megasphaera sp.]
MEHQMNGKDQAALTACIPQSLAGGIFIYKADEGETLLYASDYVIGFFGCASYEELADYVHHSFRGMVDLRDRELVEQNIRQQTASDVCQTSYARYRVIACDGTVRYAEHFSRKVTLPGVGEVYYVFIADYDRKYLTSDIDNMTGLPGNRRFLQYVRDLMESGQFLSGYCLVYFNVINFKLVNIRYGVAVGDDCLKGLATMIRETFPQGFLSRRRNDHFQLLTPEGSVREKLETLHESICQVYRKYQLEIKAGVYHFPENQVVDPALAVDYAKIACQHIRDEVGVSVLEYTQDLQKLITVNNYIAGHCDDAIEHGWIQVYYQPVIRTLTGAVCGMEALARWNDPVVGFLSPARFIPILEKNHDIYKLDCYILRQTCQALRRRLDQQLPVVSVSFNLSRLDFFLCDIFQVVEDT